MLRERSVVEVRDHDLEVSAQAAKLHDKFTDELRLHYGEILEVTNEVELLYEQLRETDAGFRDLCFKDDVYRLKKLEPMADSVAQWPSPSAAVDTTEPRKILLVSNWSLAVSNFVSRFAISSASAKLFGEVMAQFARLRQGLPTLRAYDEVISSRCREFLQYVVDSRGNNVSFTTAQWARLYYLVLCQSQEVPLPWDADQVRQLEPVLFASVFEEPLDTLLKSSDEAVTKFVHSAVFEQKSKEKTLHDVERQFHRLEELLSQPADETPTLTYPSAVHELDVTDIVHNCRLHSMGLTTTARVDMYNVVEPLTQMLRKLQESEGASDQVAKLRTRLVEILERNLPATSQEPPSAAAEPRTMDELVASITTRHDDQNASQLIRSQIIALQAL